MAGLSGDELQFLRVCAGNTRTTPPVTDAERLQDIIMRLTERGLVYFIIEGDVAIYTATERGRDYLRLH